MNLSNLKIYIVYLFICSCAKEEVLRLPQLKTGEVIYINCRDFKIEGEIIDIALGVENYGHVCSEISVPTVLDMKVSKGQTDSLLKFTSHFQHLEPDKIYFVRGFIEYDNKIIYGEQIEVKTKNLTSSELETGEVEIIYHHYCPVKANIKLTEVL